MEQEGFFQGYRNFIAVEGFWKQLMSVGFYQWFSKHLTTTLPKCCGALMIPLEHVQRKATYKGERELVQALKHLRQDCVTSLGLLLCLAAMLAARNCTKQTEIINVLQCLYRKMPYSGILWLVPKHLGLEISNNVVSKASMMKLFQVPGLHRRQGLGRDWVGGRSP